MSQNEREQKPIQIKKIAKGENFFCIHNTKRLEEEM